MLRKSLYGIAVASFLVLTGCIGDGDTVDGDDDVDPPDPDLTLSFPNAFPNLTFDSPVAMLEAPGDATRWFVVEQDGVIEVFANDDATDTLTEFLDISGIVTSPDDGSGDETGLLGMAFHPGFPQDPRVFVYYTTTVGGDFVSRLSSFETADDGETLDPDTEVVLFTVPQPETNHNGGNLAFGPDGMLYVGLGDGGGGGDDHGAIGNGQNTETLLGKIVRIDVGIPGDEEYTVPVANPFSGNDLCNTGTATGDDCPEIYAWGFRNPWRWSFDSVSDELWVGDVGQDSWEEIDKVELGGNYGWRCREGANDFNLDCGDADVDDLIDPVVQYQNTDADFSVIGGFVYRGTSIPELAGRYVFGDLGGRMWDISRDTVPTAEVDDTDGVDTSLQIVSFAQDQDGELYIVDGGGTIHRIEAE